MQKIVTENSELIRVYEDLTESFSENEVDGQITIQLHVNGKLACEAVLLCRECLMTIDSYPPKRGYGTKMMDYFEKKALEHGFSTVEVREIKDDEGVKDFFRKRGYVLTPNPQILDEFNGTKKLK